jgi:SAM-dependent methyltransferase
MKDLRASAKDGAERLKRIWRGQRSRRVIARNRGRAGPPPVAPVWPLPRRPGGPSDDEIRARFAEHKLWHYAYQFTGGLDFTARHADRSPLADSPERPLQRFRHFMPWLLDASGGTLAGKRVLDIACNSGFWSIQCALLGAREVVGFDAREELIEQANLIASIVGADNTQFRVLDFWDMRPETLGGSFDVVLNLGVLYHLPKTLEALELTKAIAREHVVLDTVVLPTPAPLIRVRWEEPADIRNAATAGVSMTPSRPSVELMLRHLNFTAWAEIPLRTADMPDDYLVGNRASWLIRV